MDEPLYDAPIEPRSTIAAYFGTLAQSSGTRGPLGELTELLASGRRDVGAFIALRKRYAVDGEQWFRKQVEDLFLGFVRSTLEGKSASPAELAVIRDLRHYLRMHDGDLVAHRPTELTQILGEQIEHILEDRVVSASEELLQVELQSALGIGYDDYIKLTRNEFERLHTALLVEISQGGEAAAVARQQLSTIEPIYQIATPNKKLPGAFDDID